MAISYQVVKALENWPWNATKKKFSLFKLATYVHVREQEAFPMSILLFCNVILK
jgi:hypothetical protein